MNRNVSHLLQVRTHISLPCITPQVVMSVGLVNAVYIRRAIPQDVILCHFEQKMLYQCMVYMNHYITMSIVIYVCGCNRKL